MAEAPSTRVVVLGRTGQLGAALEATRWPAGWRVRTIDRTQVDLAAPDTLAEALDRLQPELLINAAGYTQVDRAEVERDLALRVNAEAPGVLARWCAARDVPFVQVSTDYVFGGKAHRPYREDDAVGPINAYGHGKLAGEAAVRDAGGRHLIVRTAWLHAPAGRNFVTTLLDIARSRPVVSVVADQHGAPTFAPDVAVGIVALAAAAQSGKAAWGTYHLTNTGSTTWAGFAGALFRAARRHGLAAAEVEPIPASAWPAPTRRPAYSVLATGRFQVATGLVPPSWEDGVERCVARIAAARRTRAHA